MGPPAAGAVVLIPFPFSDLSDAKLRPAVVLAPAGRDDWIVCQITSRPYADPSPVELADSDFLTGGLMRPSFARPLKLFTANSSLFQGEAGVLQDARLAHIRDIVVAALHNGSPA